MDETESPSAALRRLIAEEKAVRSRFAVFEGYREGIQTEIETGTSLRSILRNINRHRQEIGKEAVTFFGLAHYVRTVGFRRSRRNPRKPPAKPSAP